MWHRVSSKRRRLRRRTLVLTALGVSMMLALIGISDYLSLRESMDQRLKERLVLARMVAGDLEYLLIQNLSNLQSLLFFPGVHLGDDDLEPEKSALHAVGLHSICSSVFLLDRQGRLMWKEPQRGPGIPQDFSHLAPVRRVLRDGKPTVSNLMETGPGRIGVLLLIPLMENGEMRGFLGGEVDPTGTRLSGILRNAAVGDTGYVDVVDGAGRIIASSRSRRVLQESDHKGYLSGLIASNRSSVSTCHSCHEQESRQQTEVMAFVPLSQISWGVVIRQSEAEALAPVRSMKTRFLLFGFFILAVATVVTWGVAQSVIRPVKALTGSAMRIATGDLDQPIPHTGADEIGELGNALEEMRKRLQLSLNETAEVNRDLEKKIRERTSEVVSLYEQLKKKEKARGELLQKILTAQEEERKRVARELHDDLSQNLTALLLAMDSVQSESAADDKTRGLVLHAMDSVHRIIFDLRPAVLDDLGISAAIKWYAEERLLPLGMEVSFEGALMDEQFHHYMEIAVFRIAQEAITNIAKHSDADHVLISIERDGDFLLLEIEDDGRGFSPGRPGTNHKESRGLGLMGMRERVSLLNGTLDVESNPGSGTRIVARIPMLEKS